MKLQLMQLRKQAGFKSRDDIAEALGVNPATYTAWETGKRKMSFERACMIADFLHVTLDELAGRTDYICQYADRRQQELNNDFATLDEASKDAAAAAVKGMAIACAQASDPQGSQADPLSA